MSKLRKPTENRCNESNKTTHYLFIENNLKYLLWLEGPHVLILANISKFIDVS